jgi:hypothetical protein
MCMTVTLRGARLLSILAAIAAAVALAVVASGCGSSSATLDPVAEAAETTSASGGVHMELNMSVSSPALSSPVAVSGQGFFNYKTREGSFSLEITGLPAAAAATLGSGGLHIDELMKSSTIYVGSPLFAGRLPGGARWMKIDLAKVGGALGLNLQSLTSGESNPAQLLEFLRGHGGSVTTVGREVLEGVNTTRYRGSIDLQKLAQTLPAAERGPARGALEQLSAQSGLSSFPFEVWVDDQHRVRQMAMSISLSMGGEKAEVQITINLSRFGPTPAVTAPSASEVFDGTGTALGGLKAG